MNAVLRVVAAGPSVTLQDGGRRGFLRFGVTAAGPIDPPAHATANRAAGVPPDAAAIEVSLGGLELMVEERALSVAVAGGDFKIVCGARVLPPAAVVRLEPGATLSIRPGGSGAWCYVAVAGRIDAPPVLGSVSMHTRSGIGGRALKRGDLLTVAEPRTLEPATAAIRAPWLLRSEKVVRVVLGPQDDYFDAGQIDAFLKGPWQTSTRYDRMAYLLDGPQLTHKEDFNIVSDGIAAGAIQVAGDGRPIVLMADHPTTGGYAKIANVIGADLGRLAQFKPGTSFQFAAVSIDEAVAARREMASALSAFAR